MHRTLAYSFLLPGLDSPGENSLTSYRDKPPAAESNKAKSEVKREPISVLTSYPLTHPGPSSAPSSLGSPSSLFAAMSSPTLNAREEAAASREVAAGLYHSAALYSSLTPAAAFNWPNPYYYPSPFPFQPPFIPTAPPMPIPFYRWDSAISAYSTSSYLPVMQPLSMQPRLEAMTGPSEICEIKEELSLDPNQCAPDKISETNTKLESEGVDRLKMESAEEVCRERVVGKGLNLLLAAADSIEEIKSAPVSPISHKKDLADSGVNRSMSIDSSLALPVSDCNRNYTTDKCTEEEKTAKDSDDFRKFSKSSETRFKPNKHKRKLMELYKLDVSDSKNNPIKSNQEVSKPVPNLEKRTALKVSPIVITKKSPDSSVRWEVKDKSTTSKSKSKPKQDYFCSRNSTRGVKCTKEPALTESILAQKFVSTKTPEPAEETLMNDLPKFKKIAEKASSKKKTSKGVLSPVSTKPSKINPTLRIEDLVEGHRILARIDGRFYPSRVLEISPPDIYGYIVESERRGKPHILSQEEILQKAVRESR